MMTGYNCRNSKMTTSQQQHLLRPLVEAGRFSWSQIADKVNGQLGKHLPATYFENWAHRHHVKNHFYGDGHDQLRPKQASPIGSHRKANGYDVIKCEDGVKRYTHRVIWEQANGPIPEGKIVIFLDGDRENIALANLALANRTELAIMTLRNKRTNDGELTKAHLLRMRLNHAIKKRGKTK